MDSMDIDSGRSQDTTAEKEAPKGPAGSFCAATAALAELHDALSPFIVEQVKISLGDLGDSYLPPPAADIFGLLKYVQNKWLSIFSDSPLEHHKSAIKRLSEAAYANRRTLNPMAKDEAKKVVKDTQGVLLAMRKPGAAAKVAQLLDDTGAASIAAASQTSVARPMVSASRPRLRSVAQPAQTHPPPSVSVPPVPAEPHPPGSLPNVNIPVTLDGSNIAWRHGLSQRFSIRGIAEALAYFTGRGHPCAVFLPEGRLRDPPREDIPAPEGEHEAFAALKSLEGTSMLILTPEKDYDDCYMTHFAREYQAIIVSNDRFADQVYQAEAEGRQAALEWQRWISACRLPFTFHGHAFVPNPSFDYKRAADVAQELARPAVPKH